MNWKNILKGMAMGIVETVPGVSSSTIAILMGIYGRLIESIGQLTTRRWKESISFLIPIGIGMVGGFAISVLVISYLLEHYKIPTLLLFMGMVIGILPQLWTSSYKASRKRFGFIHYVVMLLAIAAVASTRFLGDSDTSIMTDLSFMDYLFLFISGWLASTALIFPGISGALILMILGVYYTAISAISTMDFPVILTIGSGVIAGILITSKIVRFLLHRYTLLMYALMIGLVAGSSVVLYPGFSSDVIHVWIGLFAMIGGFILAILAGRVSQS